MRGETLESSIQAITPIQAKVLHSEGMLDAATAELDGIILFCRHMAFPCPMACAIEANGTLQREAHKVVVNQVSLLKLW